MQVISEIFGGEGGWGRQEVQKFVQKDYRQIFTPLFGKTENQINLTLFVLKNVMDKILAMIF